jgi:glycosyltransferase involved in cell wall biosynthesis
MTRPLRIVHLSTVDTKGGAAKTAWKLHERLRERGHESILAVGQKQSTDPDVRVIDNSRAGQGPRGRVLRRLESLGLQYLDHPGSHGIPELVGGEWDVTHAHNLHGGYFDLAALRRLSRRAPLILTLQDMWLLTGHCAYSFDCERWRGGCGSCPDLTIYPAIPRDATRANHWRKRRRVGSLDVAIASPARWLLDLAKDSYLGAKAARLIPNPVDTKVFTPGDARAARAALDLPQDRPIVLFPANHGLGNPFKGGWMIEHAIADLRDTGVLCVSFGPARDESRENMLAIPETIDEATVAQAHRAADVVVYPSRADTSPLAILEAFATATPVVSTRVGGIPELVVDGRNGLLVEYGDAPALADAIRRLLDAPDLARRLGATGLDDAREHYDLDHVVDLWLAWYQELAEGRRRTTGAATTGRGRGGRRPARTAER